MMTISDKKINYLFYIILFIGAYLRINLYLQDRSIWLDEAYLTFNIIEKSLLELIFSPLKYNQIAPLGFILTEKLISLITGYSTLSLRVFPLACGITSILFFYKLLSKFLKPIPALLSVFIFSITPQIIYYSSEIKQYSSDILCTILCILLIIYFLNNESNKNILKSLIAMLLLILFSFQSIIFISSNSVILFTNWVKEKSQRNLIKLISWTFSWMLIYTAYYFTQVKIHTDNKYLISYWDHGYLSLDFFNNLNILDNIFKYLDLKFLILSELYLFIGMIYFFIVKKKSLVILLPCLIVCLLSFIHLYPLADRLVLFFSPIIILLFGTCFEFLLNSKITIIKLWSCILIGLLLIPSLTSLNKSFHENQDKENIKLVLDYIRKNKKPEDVIYVNHFSQYTFKYYAKEFGFNNNFILPNNWSNIPYFKKEFFNFPRWYKKPTYNDLFISKTSIWTTTNRRKINYELNLLENHKRVWIILRNDSSYYDYKLKYYLDKKGEMLFSKSFTGPNSFGNNLYLYDFSKR